MPQNITKTPTRTEMIFIFLSICLVLSPKSTSNNGIANNTAKISPSLEAPFTVPTIGKLPQGIKQASIPIPDEIAIAIL